MKILGKQSPNYNRKKCCACSGAVSSQWDLVAESQTFPLSSHNYSEVASGTNECPFPHTLYLGTSESESKILGKAVFVLTVSCISQPWIVLANLSACTEHLCWMRPGNGNTQYEYTQE